jgi:hypothetical protein
MTEYPRAIRNPVKRDSAENYLLISLSTFAITVIVTRLFLELTGYPQLGNGVLHFAHALWGGLLLVIAVMLPLILENRWVYNVSAILSGIGIGLFIDEVGKFITQENDYFFPPAAPLIYGFFLLLVLLYLFLRGTGKRNPRNEIYWALDDMRELIDNNLDSQELDRLIERLQIAKESNLPHVAGLAVAMQEYIEGNDISLVPARPGIWKRFKKWLKHEGRKLGRRRHRLILIVTLGMMSLGVLITGLILVYIAISPQATFQDLVGIFMTQAEIESVGGGFWFNLRLVLQFIVGVTALIAAFSLARGQDRRGINAALIALLLSLTGVLLLTFYLNQFSAIFAAVYEFVLLMLVVAYRDWYIMNPNMIQIADFKDM